MQTGKKGTGRGGDRKENEGDRGREREILQRLFITLVIKFCSLQVKPESQYSTGTLRSPALVSKGNVRKKLGCRIVESLTKRMYAELVFTCACMCLLACVHFISENNFTSYS